MCSDVVWYLQGPLQHRNEIRGTPVRSRHIAEGGLRIEYSIGVSVNKQSKLADPARSHVDAGLEIFNCVSVINCVSKALRAQRICPCLPC